MLDVDAVSVGVRGRRRTVTPLLTEVTLQVRPGEILALVGESGSGKSTLARTAVGLCEPDQGRVLVGGVDLYASRGRAARDLRRRCQMVFQDAGLSLSPRLTVAQAIREPLRIHRIGTADEQRAQVLQLMRTVGLDPRLGDRRPGQLSGGQRQRVAIARALALEPSVLICDEPVTALDASVQAGVLNLIFDLRDRLGLACLFIAHDLAVVRRLADRVAVMYAGRVVEQAPTGAFAVTALHPYTRSLLAASTGPTMPLSDRHHDQSFEFPRRAISHGCSFGVRCSKHADICATVPALTPLGTPPPGDSTLSLHHVACHLPSSGGPPAGTPTERENPMSDATGNIWTDLLARWDRQQDVYIEQRERRFDVMFDFLAELVPGPARTVLDLACGPGAISQRLLGRFPESRAVAVDVDPVLLAIGEGAHGDHGGRLRWVRADLRRTDWVDALGMDGEPGTFDAVLSSTALHWLTPPELIAVYRAAATLLKPGGVLINADFLPVGPGNRRIRAACSAINAGRQSSAIARGAEDWESWWKNVESTSVLGDAVTARAEVWHEGIASGWSKPGVSYHVAALREAGFAEVEMVWQDLEERVMIALMP